MLTTRPRTRETELTVSVSTAAPSVRLVIVEATAWEEDGELKSDCQIIPVFAVRTSIVDRYVGMERDGDTPRLSPNHEEMTTNGWRYSGRFVVESPLVVTRDYGIVDAEFGLDCSNGEWAPAAAPWPAEEDAVRLADLIAETTKAAIEKVKSNAARDATRKTA